MSRVEFGIDIRRKLTGADLRLEAYALSCLYRMTSSEVAVYFVILAIALALGSISGRVLRGNPEASIRFHKAAAVFITLDLAIRIIPVRANIAFGIPAAVFGLAVRAVCLYFVIRDMKATVQ